MNNTPSNSQTQCGEDGETKLSVDNYLILE